MYLKYGFLLLFIISLSIIPVSSIEAAVVSSSKLGIFILQPTAGGTSILNSGPRIISVFDPHKNANIVSMVRTYKSKFPQGQVIMRVYDGTQTLHYALTDDPAASALDYWTKALKPAYMALPATDRSLFDYMSGPVEYNTTPKITSTAEAQWVNAFWITLSDQMHQLGLKPNMGEIPVGNPDVSALNVVIPSLVPALQKIKLYGGFWSYHAYTINYTTDVGAEIWYSLRYRQVYTYLQQTYPDLATMPMVLTEAGVDQTGDPATSGWQARGDAAKYEAWLTWFDGQIKQDSYIIGATIFQSGDTYWSSFNTEPIAPWLETYILNPNITNAPTPTISCTQKKDGDSNCDGLVNLADFEIFRKENFSLLTTKTSDYNGDGAISLLDYNIWRKTAYNI